MAHPLFTPEAKFILEKGDAADVQAFFEALHPATVAEALSDDSFGVEELWQFLSQATIANQATLFPYFPLETQVRLVEGSGRQPMARLIEAMSSDDRAELVRALNPKAAENLLRLVDEADRRDIATLMRYPEDSAGGLMTTDYAWLPAHVTVEQALERLRLQAPNTETIYYIYVVDEHRHLLGVVSLRDLILASRRAVISDLMETKVVTVHDTDSLEKVTQTYGDLDLLAIPVVNADNRLVGIITHDDLFERQEEEATEDMHRMGGVVPLEESYLQASLVTLWRKRSMWLACLFLAELFTFTAMAYYEDAIAEVVVLSLFIPLVISTGGNSGSQAATLLCRAMALGQVTPGLWFRVLRREIIMGLALGLTLGLIGLGRAWLTSEDLRSSAPARHESFQVRVPHDEPLTFTRRGGLVNVVLPERVAQIVAMDRPVTVRLPEKHGEEIPSWEDGSGHLVYQFPAGCQLPRTPINRWGLALVIGFAVAGVCLWGTVVGSMLPLLFDWLGADAAVASSPFVATLVDVTGIVLYFSIAHVVLFDVLG